MTAAEMAPPIRFDRYLALLAVLLAIVLGLLVMSERQRQPADPLLVEGTLPPPPDPRLRTVAAERDALIAEGERLTSTLEQREAALAASEAALEELETEARWLADENERLDQLLGSEVAQRQALAQRVALIEAERDRLDREVQSLRATRERLESRIAELSSTQRGARPSPPADAAPAAGATSRPAGPSLDRSALAERYEPGDPTDTLTNQPSLSQALDALIDEQRTAAARAEILAAEESGPASGQEESESVSESESDTESVAESAADATPEQSGGRIITFNGAGGTVADGVAAYQAADYRTAARIWGALAAAGNPRAQFHFGSLLFEGRLGEPDLVMAHVWLNRAVTGGHLPAIDMRRRVEAEMSEADYEQALAIEASS